MWSDNETSLDLISINHYVATVLELVGDNTLLPLTMGIFGDWGNGKSSLLKMVKEKLDTQEKTLCLYFNGWLFEDYDDAKAALMGTILDEIEKKPTLSAQAKKTIENLRKKVNWLGLLGVAGKYGLSTLAGGPVGGLAAISVDAGKALFEKIKSGDTAEFQKLVNAPIADSTQVRKNIHEFREEFSKLLEESKIEKLVVIIDDLDRCLPDTIINTLEAIKLFLFSDNTAFLISIDERVIKHAINVRYSSFDAKQREDISRDYVEKLIQIPLRVPLMNKSEMKSYINLLFATKQMSKVDFDSLLAKVIEARKGESFNVAIDLAWLTSNTAVNDAFREELMITEQINDLLYDFLKGNPRQVKRFINALLLRMKLARLRGVNLKKQMLAKLMALEYMNVGHFRQLSDWQSTQNGKPQEIVELEEKAKSNEDKKTSDDPHKWLQNDLINRWLKSEPHLSGENLEPYFYISRDTITYFPSISLKLTENEKLVFDNLIAVSETHRNKGKKAFETIAEQEALNITNALIEHGSKIDLNTDGADIVLTITSLSKIRPVATEAILDFLNTMDEKYLEPAIIPELRETEKHISPELKAKLSVLFEKFRKCENKMLASAVDS